MKKAIICIAFCVSLLKANVGITYLDSTYWGGRLGDQLMMYVKAKIISYYTGIPLYIKSFPYINSFALWKKERHMSDLKIQSAEKVLLRNLSNFEEIKYQKNKLFIAHYYFQMDNWGDAQKKYDTQEVVDWVDLIENQELLEEIRTMLSPIHDEIPLLLPPREVNSVAVHVRKTSGGDMPMVSNQLYDIHNLNINSPQPSGNYSDINYPTKNVPDQYYIDQIKYLYHYLEEKPLFVFIFTDYTNPEYLCRLYREQCQGEKIIFDCRKGAYDQVNTQVQDILSMARYDYLIRGGSNFPQISQLMGRHRLVIYPKSVKWIGKHLVVNEVGIYKNPSCKNS